MDYFKRDSMIRRKRKRACNMKNIVDNGRIGLLSSD